MKHIIFIVLLALTFTLTACTEQQTNDEDLIEMTLEELAQFDGRDGRKAYIAVNGYIYDVTGSPRWPNGNHNGNQAGQDLTDEILGISPHGTSVLNRMPRIGILVEAHESTPQVED